MTSSYRPTAFEVAACWLPGLVPADPAPAATRRTTLRRTGEPLEAIKGAVRRAAAGRPVAVTFSGGRDSSAVLAVATAVAREDGAPDPVPVTFRYPGVAEADESAWQESVVRHLGLATWRRIVVGGGENDLLGEGARESLLRRGLLFPATMHVKDAMLRELRGHAVLTGEGGDEVFGDRRSRALLRVARGQGRVGTPRRAALASLLPGPGRRWREHAATARSTAALTWLTRGTTARLADEIARDAAAEPLSYARGLRWLRRRRASRVFLDTFGQVAAEHDVALAHPLLDDGFLGALGARHPWGFADRTAGMRAVFGTLLPDAVCARSSKASFNRAYLGAATRDFAVRWGGDGVDPALVDVGGLRAAWLSGFPPGPTSLLLQQAWLASVGAEAAR
ncbi:asparagine synthase-related protein [Krasilnikoviella flava]|uniref:Asparagine synthase (Glutamine-hydrolysing) n=1 Tax=Krasilnikoviella flava TaxID=526729 RepID=A0A1T5IDW7_9MICO|nr:asparagine synthase-related protein [Krasilnikoviella flava]SKC37337.1 asparagine synthase (glutamine-hydrolysing) [Krasilnikoviella flava]